MQLRMRPVFLCFALGVLGCWPAEECQEPFKAGCNGDERVSFVAPSGLSCGYVSREICLLGCASGRCLQSSLGGARPFGVSFSASYKNEHTWTQAVVLAEHSPESPSWQSLVETQGRLVLIETPLHFNGTRAIGPLFGGGSRVVVAASTDGGAPLRVATAATGTVTVNTNISGGPKVYGSFDVSLDIGERLTGSFIAPARGDYDGRL